MAAVWYTSDLHLGHRMVAGLRGFSDVTDHDEMIIVKWRRYIKKDDTIFVLGDLTLERPDRRVLDLIAALPGVKHLVAGNHDACHPMHRDAPKWQRRYLETFASVQSAMTRKLDGHKVLLSHFPYTGDHTAEDRHNQWRLPDRGEWLLHGHTHMAHQRKHGRQMHVGVDAWDLEPVHQETIIEMIRGV